VGRKGPKDAGEDPGPVGAAIEREVVPTVRVALADVGGQVGRVGEDEVELTQAAGEVGADRRHVEASRLGRSSEPPEGFGVEVGRNHAGAGARRRERDRPVPTADLEDRFARLRRREAEQQFGILSGRIHLDPPFGR
jgi:hypothetical protein